MSTWDEVAPDDSTSIAHKYYCMVCEEFFVMTPLAPLRCPTCFADGRYILGPIPVKEVDISKYKRKQKEKYGSKMRR